MANVRIVDSEAAARIAIALWVVTVLTCVSAPWTVAAVTGERSERSESGESGESAKPGNNPSAHAITCFVSILPQAYFVEQIGGERVNVSVMVGPGQSPATYEPTAKQLTGLAGARIYFSIGVPFEEALLSRIERNFEHVTIVDTRAGIETTQSPDDEVEEKKTPAGDHNHHHSSFDPHVWLSPRLAKTIAVNIRDALVTADPAQREAYDDNYRALVDDLNKLDREVTALLAQVKGGRFYVFHPAYGHFAAEYGLVQVAVEIEGATPGPKHLANIIERAEADNVRVLFVQPQFSKNTVDMIAKAIGAKVVPLDPLAPDYPVNLLEIARSISDALVDNDGVSPSLKADEH
jgi:zinc transport system substrate-binding protein